MVINVAIAALSKKILASCTQDCPSHIDVFAQTPYYSAYPFLSELDSTTARWNPNADPNSPWTIEILTLVSILSYVSHASDHCIDFACSYPNNPSGVKRSPLVKDPEHVIVDMVYYWPMYTDIDVKMNEPIMIFSRYSGLMSIRKRPLYFSAGLS